MRFGPGTRVAAGAAAVGAVAAAAGWAAVLEPRRLVVRHRTLRPPLWPASHDGLRIACVADLHAGAPQVDEERVAGIAERVDGLDADLVALLGDFVDHEVALGSRPDADRIARALGAIRAPRFAVLGNHDHRFGPAEVAAALRRAGIPVLVNEVADHRGLRVAGLDDASCGRPDLRLVHDATGPLLVLSHDPDLFPRLSSAAALTLSGHTHGGQVNLPWARPRVTPSRFGDRYVRGAVREGDKLLFVTSGVGTSRLPVRLLRPPEIVLLTVRAGG